MTSGGKEAVIRAEMAAAQKAYRQQAAAEDRLKRRLAARDIALDACQRALLEYQELVPRMKLSDELAKASEGRADPRDQLKSLGKRALLEIKKAREA